jgi:hypothetical protein
LGDCGVERLPALLEIANMLRSPLVSLQPGELEPSGGGDL